MVFIHLVKSIYFVVTDRNCSLKLNSGLSSFYLEHLPFVWKTQKLWGEFKRMVHPSGNFPEKSNTLFLFLPK